MNSSLHDPASEARGGCSAAVAIVGMAGRFPGAPTLDDFWRNLRDGVESIRTWREGELRAAGVPQSSIDDPRFVAARGALEGIDRFDARFFGLSAREAALTDPQHRLFLECSWEALEHAGYAPGSGARVGVYAGCGPNTYLLTNLAAQTGLAAEADSLQLLLASDKDYLATRVSYKLDLRGPSITVQTACSTSLVAVHLACQGLLLGECDAALAGGVSVAVPQVGGYRYERGGILSPDGHCRPFDARAQGTVAGDGVGVVMLKRLEDALDGGDRIHAVIRGSAVNNDGARKIGYTAPSIEGQAKVIWEALEVAGVDPATIGYVEAHGTGTALGDPVEVAALARAFARSGLRRESCALGSVKANIGHLDVAAGIAGLIKAVLALRHGVLPPSLHFERLNPEISLVDTPFVIRAAAAPWPRGATPRRAAVSSFGMGGTNAHVVLEEALASPPAVSRRPVHLLCLSARTPTALDEATRRLADALHATADEALPDVAFTLQAGRRAFEHRRIVVGRDREEAVTALQRSLTAPVSGTVPVMRPPAVIFLFPGQGSQHLEMARGLYEAEPPFREDLDRCAELLGPSLGRWLPDLLYPPVDQDAGAATLLRRTAMAQPALVAVSYALARLWIRWGVRPAAMIGHSVGEFVAAILAGVIGLEDALASVALRGRLMQPLPSGALLAVQLPEARARQLVTPGLALTAVNEVEQCVLGGPYAAVEELQARLRDAGIGAVTLETSHAFHTPMMEPAVSPFGEWMANLSLRHPQIPYVSSLTGDWITPEEATDPAYYGRQIVGTVRFHEALQRLAALPGAVLLEVGPGQTLTRIARRSLGSEWRARVLPSLPHPQAGTDVEQVARTLGELWTGGVEVDWQAYHAGESCRRIPLPTYPFEREHFWIPAGRAAAADTPAEPTAEPAVEGPRSPIGDWFHLPSWRRAAPLASPEVEEGRAIVAFVGGDPLARAIVERLRSMAVRVITVSPGPSYSRVDPGHHVIRPRVRSDYDRVFASLPCDESILSVVHLWSLEPSGEAAGETPCIDGESCFYGLLLTAQAIHATRPARPARIDLVTCGVQEVLGDEPLDCMRAVQLGPCRVIPQEMPEIRCRNIDLVRPARADAGEQELVEPVVAELLADPQGAPLSDAGDTVALRGRQRWVQTYEPHPLAARPPAPALRDGGVYWIVGGLGRVGLSLASYLARTVRARLVLSSRTALPPRGSWADLLANPTLDAAQATRLRALWSLEELGAVVLTATADVSDEAALRDVLRLAEERFGTVHGVVHAAGAEASRLARPVAETEVGDADHQFLAKVRGTLTLARVLEGRSLDFCVLCSSLASVLGGLGFAAYAGANCFLDLFAHERGRERRTRWTSVNWDGWDPSPDPTTASFSVPTTLITPAEGGEALGRVLAAQVGPQVLVSATPLRPRLARWRASRAGPPVSTPAATGPAPPSRSARGVWDPEQALLDIWRELLGQDGIRPEDDFFALGGDSLLAVQLLSRIRAALGIDLPVRSVFELRTVTGLAGLVEERRKEEGDHLPSLQRVARAAYRGDPQTLDRS